MDLLLRDLSKMQRLSYYGLRLVLVLIDYVMSAS